MSLLDCTVMPPAKDAATEKELKSLSLSLRTQQPAELILANGQRIRLLPQIAEVLSVVATAMEHGDAVSVMPTHTTLTTQQAADLLGVSRPTFVKLLEEGQIPYTTPSRHRRILLSDVLDYRQRQQGERRAGLDELARLSDEGGLYDEENARTRLRR